MLVPYSMSLLLRRPWCWRRSSDTKVRSFLGGRRVAEAEERSPGLAFRGFVPQPRPPLSKAIRNHRNLEGDELVVGFQPAGVPAGWKPAPRYVAWPLTGSRTGVLTSSTTWYGRSGWSRCISGNDTL